ncbi:unnamed protein product [Amoebophrya sp. A120]|nr:unnamed protein product [Amoebophrya sp. A120]|eukprot:GSA120T00015917001.1
MRLPSLISRPGASKSKMKPWWTTRRPLHFSLPTLLCLQPLALALRVLTKRSASTAPSARDDHPFLSSTGASAERGRVFDAPLQDEIECDVVKQEQCQSRQAGTTAMSSISTGETNSSTTATTPSSSATTSSPHGGTATPDSFSALNMSELENLQPFLTIQEEAKLSAVSEAFAPRRGHQSLDRSSLDELVKTMPRSFVGGLFGQHQTSTDVAVPAKAKRFLEFLKAACSRTDSGGGTLPTAEGGRHRPEGLFAIPNSSILKFYGPLPCTPKAAIFILEKVYQEYMKQLVDKTRTYEEMFRNRYGQINPQEEEGHQRTAPETGGFGSYFAPRRETSTSHLYHDDRLPDLSVHAAHVHYVDNARMRVQLWHSWKAQLSPWILKVDRFRYEKPFKSVLEKFVHLSSRFYDNLLENNIDQFLFPRSAGDAGRGGSSYSGNDFERSLRNANGFLNNHFYHFEENDPHLETLFTNTRTTTAMEGEGSTLNTLLPKHVAMRHLVFPEYDRNLEVKHARLFAGGSTSGRDRAASAAGGRNGAAGTAGRAAGPRNANQEQRQQPARQNSDFSRRGPYNNFAPRQWPTTAGAPAEQHISNFLANVADAARADLIEEELNDWDRTFIAGNMVYYSLDGTHYAQWPYDPRDDFALEMNAAQQGNAGVDMNPEQEQDQLEDDEAEFLHRYNDFITRRTRWTWTPETGDVDDILNHLETNFDEDQAGAAAGAATAATTTGRTTTSSDRQNHNLPSSGVNSRRRSRNPNFLPQFDLRSDKHFLLTYFSEMDRQCELGSYRGRKNLNANWFTSDWGIGLVAKQLWQDEDFVFQFVNNFATSCYVKVGTGLYGEASGAEHPSSTTHPMLSVFRQRMAGAPDFWQMRSGPGSSTSSHHDADGLTESKSHRRFIDLGLNPIYRWFSIFEAVGLAGGTREYDSDEEQIEGGTGRTPLSANPFTSFSTGVNLPTNLKFFQRFLTTETQGKAACATTGCSSSSTTASGPKPIKQETLRIGQTLVEVVSNEPTKYTTQLKQSLSAIQSFAQTVSMILQFGSSSSTAGFSHFHPPSGLYPGMGSVRRRGSGAGSSSSPSTMTTAQLQNCDVNLLRTTRVSGGSQSVAGGTASIFGTTTTARSAEEDHNKSQVKQVYDFIRNLLKTVLHAKQYLKEKIREQDLEDLLYFSVHTTSDREQRLYQVDWKAYKVAEIIMETFLDGPNSLLMTFSGNLQEFHPESLGCVLKLQQYVVKELKVTLQEEFVELFFPPSNPACEYGVVGRGLSRVMSNFCNVL